MSNSRKKRFILPPTMRKRGESLEQAAGLVAQELRQKATSAEKRFKAALIALGVQYKFQRVFLCRDYGRKSRFYVVDFYVGACRLAIEIDGEYHDTAEQQEYDRHRTALLTRQHDIRIVRFRNSDTALPHIGELIRQAIEDRFKEQGRADKLYIAFTQPALPAKHGSKKKAKKIKRNKNRKPEQLPKPIHKNTGWQTVVTRREGAEVKRAKVKTPRKINPLKARIATIQKHNVNNVYTS